MQNAVLLVNGGGGNGVDAAIASTVRSLKGRGYDTIGIREGVKGLMAKNILDGHTVLLTDKPRDVTLEGCLIGFSREPFAIPGKESAFYDLSYDKLSQRDRQSGGDQNIDEVINGANQKRAEIVRQNLKVLDAKLLVVVGGDGTFRSLTEFFRFYPELENMTIGLLNTMDNDGYTATNDAGTMVPLNAGYPSAAYKLQRYTERLQRWVERFGNCIGIHETLGRDKGWATAATSLGGAQIVILPDYIFDQKMLEDFYERVLGLYRMNGNQLTISVSEGARFSKEIVGGLSVEGQSMAHAFREESDGNHRVYLIVPPGGVSRRLGGAGFIIQLLLNKKFPEIKAYVWPSGYAARAADPETGLGAIPYDLKYNFLLGQMVGLYAEADRFGVVPTLSNVVGFEDLNTRAFRETPLRISEIKQAETPSEYLNQPDINITTRFTDYIRRITSGPKDLTGEQRDSLSRILNL